MYAYIDSFRKFGKTNTDNQSIKIKRPYPERQGLFFRPLTSGTQRPVYSTATPRANVRNASNSAGEIASG